MKFLDTQFDDYIKSINKISLHPKITDSFNNFPNNISELNNIIFYGPSGVGKYTQSLECIKKYSNSQLKYDKKMNVNFNKNNILLKISDIHFEIDMSLLGCNSKILWNDIFINIIDVLSARINKHGIILCKNFHKIHNELLECFYSYIQKTNNNIHIIFFIITENISFIPDNILNNFHIISFPRPTKSNYNKILNNKISSSINIKDIDNIKNILTNTKSHKIKTTKLTQKIYNYIINPINIKFTTFRDLLYDIFIYDMDIGNVLWIILKTLIYDKKIPHDKIDEIHIDIYLFLQLYNNNYRPIYHLENYLYSLINKVHGF
mgnify:CR=1 FL=1